MANGKSVSIKAGSGPDAQGYLVEPGKERPGVVVIQEWWGLVPHIKDVAGRFAAQGYTALCPDLFHGKTTTEEAEAQHLAQSLDWGRATQEIGGAVRLLREQGCTRVGVVGFCMGGALALIAAATAEVDAYAAFYGFPPEGAAPVDKITAPGEIFFGEHETHFSVPSAKAFVERQRNKGIATELTVYPGAAHAFFNNDRPQVYKKDAANDAWRRTLDLFGARLR